MPLQVLEQLGEWLDLRGVTKEELLEVNLAAVCGATVLKEFDQRWHIWLGAESKHRPIVTITQVAGFCRNGAQVRLMAQAACPRE